MNETRHYEITRDDLSGFSTKGPAFVTFGEVMVRDTPADTERPERTRLVPYVTQGGPAEDSEQALSDVFWVLLNSSEFVFNH